MYILYMYACIVYIPGEILIYGGHAIYTACSIYTQFMLHTAICIHACIQAIDHYEAGQNKAGDKAACKAHLCTWLAIVIGSIATLIVFGGPIAGVLYSKLA